MDGGRATTPGCRHQATDRRCGSNSQFRRLVQPDSADAACLPCLPATRRWRHS